MLCSSPQANILCFCFFKLSHFFLAWMGETSSPIFSRIVLTDSKKKEITRWIPLKNMFHSKTEKVLNSDTKTCKSACFLHATPAKYLAAVNRGSLSPLSFRKARVCSLAPKRYKIMFFKSYVFNRNKNEQHFRRTTGSTESRSLYKQFNFKNFRSK